MHNPNDLRDTLIYCDLCCLTPSGELKWPSAGKPSVAKWDAPTFRGQWAYVCRRHQGQILVLNSVLAKYELKSQKGE